ncbi:TetR/AcrR family transcriptional repressor of nem operon [Nitrobacteraceae bacterium AZCC 2146]
MGRVSYSQSLENRARIVKVASELFRANGVEAVTIADVMKAAGMTQGGFYTHFETKDHLAAEACTLSFVTSVENWQRVAAKSASDGRSVLSELARFYLAPKEPARTCPMIAFAFDAGAREPDHPLRQAYEEGVKSLFDAFSQIASSNVSQSSRDETYLLFAAMVGSNMLSQGVDAGRWTNTFKKVVRSAAETH